MQIALSSPKALIDSEQTPTLQTEEAPLVGKICPLSWSVFFSQIQTQEESRIGLLSWQVFSSQTQTHEYKHKHMNTNTNTQICCRE